MVHRAAAQAARRVHVLSGAGGAATLGLLVAEGLACGYGTVAVLRGVDLAVAPGEMVALLGRNGCGKSTLLRTLGGALPPLSGRIWLAGQPLERFSRREAARILAVVSQELQVPFAFSVREVVDLGRAPHARFLQPPTHADAAVVDRALAGCDLLALADRPYQRLSGGEQQRVALAMALAQEPRALLLDEPTVHLDVAHQVGLLALVRSLCAEQGLAVLAAMHDINLTTLFFDRLLVLAGGAVVSQGTPQETITAPLIARAFGTAVVVTAHPTRGVPQVSLLP